MPPGVNRTMSAPEWAMLLSLSVLWGGSFFLTHVALSALPVCFHVDAKRSGRGNPEADQPLESLAGADGSC